MEAPERLREEEVRLIDEEDGTDPILPEVLALLDHLAKEPEMHRRFSGWYAYEFFVVRRPTAPKHGACGHS